MAVGGIKLLAVGNENRMVNGDKVTLNLNDALIMLLGGKACFLEYTDALAYRSIAGKAFNAVNIGEYALRKIDGYLRLGLCNSICNGGSATKETFSGKVGSGSVNGLSCR